MQHQLVSVGFGKCDRRHNNSEQVGKAVETGERKEDEEAGSRHDKESPHWVQG